MVASKKTVSSSSRQVMDKTQKKNTTKKNKKNGANKGKKKTLVDQQKKEEPEPVVEKVDPWKKYQSVYGGMISPAEQWSKLKDILDHVTGWTTFSKEQVLEVQKIKSKQVQVEKLQLLLGESAADDQRDDDELNLNFMNCGIERVTRDVRDEIWAKVVCLDLCNNEIEEMTLEGGRNSYLRHLNISGNKLSRFPDTLAPFSKLLSLDISHNIITDLQSVAKATPNLRRVICKDCGLDSQSMDAVKIWGELEELDVRNNNIADVEKLRQGIIHVKRKLITIRIDGNPISDLETASFHSWLKKECPRLAHIEDDSVSHSLQTTTIDDLQQHVSNNETMVQDSSNCSCIEGNPCAVEYNCLNWKDRFKIAENARRELGYQLNQ